MLSQPNLALPLRLIGCASSPSSTNPPGGVLPAVGGYPRLPSSLPRLTPPFSILSLPIIPMSFTNFSPLLFPMLITFQVSSLSSLSSLSKSSLSKTTLSTIFEALDINESIVLFYMWIAFLKRGVIFAIFYLTYLKKLPLEFF